MSQYALVEVSQVKKQNSEHTRLQMAQVLEMRTAGLSFPQIARQMGTTQKFCFTLYARALDAIIAPGVEQLRKQEGERLDAMLLTVMTPIMDARNKALTGEAYEPPIDAITAALKISERRARIFGLDSPTKVMIPTGNGPAGILENLNMASMSTAELVTLRELLGKAGQAGPLEDGDEPHGDG